MKNGWTRAVVDKVDDGAVRFSGDDFAGLAVQSPLLAGAKAGQRWLVKVRRTPALPFGEITEARRVSEV